MLSPGRKRFTTVLTVLVVLIGLLVHGNASATTPYGTGEYGNDCPYSTGCKQSPQHTIIPTPSGLEVAINLINGQIIPARDGYTITVTPLNGSGRSFAEATFYIDGRRAGSAVPAENGTASWRWDTLANPGSRVTVTVTDETGQLTSHTFKVVLQEGAGAATTTPPPGSLGRGQPASSFVASALSRIGSAAKQLVRKLPAPVVYVFPWILLLLLIIEIIILLLQTRRELREQRTLERFAAHEREMATLKQTFSQLISHYLRTPFTIISGGAEGLSAAQPALGPTIQQAITQLQNTIESLILRAGTATAGHTLAEPSNQPLPRNRLSGQIAIWLPVLLIGVIAYAFGYIANHATSYHAGMLTIFAQIAVYSILVLATYQVVRRLQLRRRDQRAAADILAQEQSIQAAQDAFISQAAPRLAIDIKTLENLLGQLSGTSSDVTFIKNGITQLKAVENKFIVAASLKGSHSTDPYLTVSAQALFADATANLSSVARAKQVACVLQNDANLHTQNTGLLTLVLHSLVDNALAYGKTGTKVEVSVASEAGTEAISVTDYGSSIPQETLAFLARPFYKAEGAVDFNHEGMGFSLYLDKLIMRYLGGELAFTPNTRQSTVVKAFWKTV